MMFVVFLNASVFIFGVFRFFSCLKLILNGRRSILLISLLLFEIEFVFSLLVETVWYVLQLKVKMFPAMDYALCDSVTSIIYLIFVLLTQEVLFLFAKKSQLTFFVLKMPAVPKTVFFVFKILRFAPVYVLFFAPEVSAYFQHYAPFTFHAGEYSQAALIFHRTVMVNSARLAFISVLLVELFRKKENKKQKLVQYLAIVIFTILNGKRTLFAFTILGMVALDVIRSRKIKIKKMVFELSLVIIFFVLYSLFSGKGNYYGSNSMNLIMNYLLYFDRSFVTKIAIFNKFHPDLVHILDYPGQSILFNVFFWIPRRFWANKPYPYAVYFTSGTVGNLSFSMVPWRFQTAVYPEWISNFGIIGVPVILFIYIWFVGTSEKKKNFLIYFIALLYSCFMQMFEFTGTPQYFLLFWIFLILFKMIDFKYVFKLHNKSASNF